MVSGGTDWKREPGRGKYARFERERRFFVRDGVPPLGEAARLIEDRYLDATCLRLRRVTWQGQAVHKLTQKVRPNGSDPAEVLITNMYLSATEYARLFTLSGADLVKARAVIPTATHDFVVDEFQGPLQGLRLAEVEVMDLAESVDLPEWLGDEVTHDDRFSGGRLAVADDRQFREMLRGR
jgi:CYTH domain-containing protein